MKRETYYYAAAPLSIAIALGIFLFAKNASRQQLAGQADVTSADHASNSYPRQSQPDENAPALVQKETPGTLQRGVSGSEASVFLELQTAGKTPAFDQTRFTVHPNEIVSLTFRNQSDPEFHYLHSFVLVNPGTEGSVEIAANRAGPQNHYLPTTPDVLAHTRLLGSGESETIFFKAPEKPGNYPYICTFPGHGGMMRGTLRVR